MKIGIPKEIKNHEYRVSITPNSAQEIILQGHQVLIETQAGAGIGFSDENYLQVGANIYQNAADIFRDADMSQRAAAKRIRLTQTKPNPVYLFAPCCRRSANPSAD